MTKYDGFMCNIRVRYQETDQMGVVYHTNYLNWFEIGRTEFVRELGYPYAKLEQAGLLLPVTHAELEFRQPARYDDIIRIYIRVAELTPLRIQFDAELRRMDNDEDLGERGLLATGTEPAGELLVRGYTKHVWVNKEWRPVRVSKLIPDIYQKLEKMI